MLIRKWHSWLHNLGKSRSFHSQSSVSRALGRSMDPKDPATFNHRTLQLSTGRAYHFVDQLPVKYSPKSTKTLLCVHGFPDLWYGWRFQIGPWVRQGYRVVVPDMLGYGGTDCPTDSSEYSTKRLCDDLAALLDALAVHKAVLIGHDWGSFIVGRFALWHPERLLALIMMCVPYTPPTPVYVPVEEVARRAPNLGYQVYFSKDVSTGEIEKNLSKFFHTIYRPPSEEPSFTREGDYYKNPNNKDQGPTVLDKSEMDYYLKNFSRGMKGPLSYYRTQKVRHDEEQAAKFQSNLRSDLDVLLLWGTADPTATPTQINRAKKWINRLKTVALEGKGHWVMVEASDAVTRTVLEWLENLQPNLKGKL